MKSRACRSAAATFGCQRSTMKTTRGPSSAEPAVGAREERFKRPGRSPSRAGARVVSARQDRKTCSPVRSAIVASSGSGQSASGTGPGTGCVAGAQGVWGGRAIPGDYVAVRVCPHASVKTHRVCPTEGTPHKRLTLGNNDVSVLARQG